MSSLSYCNVKVIRTFEFAAKTQSISRSLLKLIMIHIYKKNTILNSLLFKGFFCWFVWLLSISDKNSTRTVIMLYFHIAFEFLYMAMNFLLSYVKKHAEECYEECQTPRKLLILVIFSFVSLGLVGSGVIKNS